jgi:hypothetical protein
MNLITEKAIYENKLGITFNFTPPPSPHFISREAAKKRNMGNTSLPGHLKTIKP